MQQQRSSVVKKFLTEIKFTVRVDNGKILPIGKVLIRDNEPPEIGSIGIPILLDRRVHTKLMPYQNQIITLIGTLKIEERDNSTMVIFFIANSFLFIDEADTKKYPARRILFGG